MPAEFPRKALCEIITDVDGSRHYIVERDKIREKLFGSQIDVWWNRAPRKKIGGRTVIEEMIVLRQQDFETEKADVICLTHRQAYALIDAVCRAIESR